MTKLIESILLGVAEERLLTFLLALCALLVGLYMLALGTTGRIPIPQFLRKLFDGTEKAPLLPGIRRALAAFAALPLILYGVTNVVELAFIHELVVVTSLTESEYEQLQTRVKEFEEEQEDKNGRLRVRVTNAPAEKVPTLLAERRVDLAIFDINRRTDVVREGLIRPLDGGLDKDIGWTADLTRYLPATVHPALLPDLSMYGRRYFLPYRPNVRIVWNRETCEHRPATWEAVKASGHRALVSADGGYENSRGTDAALLLLELIRAARADEEGAAAAAPRDLCSRENAKTLEFVHDLMLAVHPASKTSNWQTATGELIAEESLCSSRNWSFSVSALRRSQQLERFAPSSGWRWQREGKLSTLLGGDVMAIPRSARYPHEAPELIAFLVSQRSQARMVSGLAWPPMRFDALPSLDTTPVAASRSTGSDAAKSVVEAAPPGQETSVSAATSGEPANTERKTQSPGAALHFDKAMQAVTEALHAATATPRYWSSEIRDAYSLAFRIIVESAPTQARSELQKHVPLFCGDHFDPQHVSVAAQAEPYRVSDFFDAPRVRLELRGSNQEPISYHSDMCAVVRWSGWGWHGQSPATPWRAGHRWVEVLFPENLWPTVHIDAVELYQSGYDEKKGTSEADSCNEAVANTPRKLVQRYEQLGTYWRLPILLLGVFLLGIELPARWRAKHELGRSWVVWVRRMSLVLCLVVYPAFAIARLAAVRRAWSWIVEQSPLWLVIGAFCLGILLHYICAPRARSSHDLR